ncbi:GcrA cell cycle regulator [Salinihabitans flavidus]|uniref:GcrA cell cycle regulator n=1 Tax=Salinihabitans flavidus TaxID=569882 RepID=A0A1H8REW5_9RHOB|nr:GcrA family cell cycle regulator [Salinihabitans flavidus]SEO65079.1 GcrA cell cycle regulator [Salinihabitans flavidus]
MSWTDERVELLKKMWSEGQSASQIAKELGSVTRNAVIGKVHRLGLSNRTQPGAKPEAEPASKPEPKQKAAPKAAKADPKEAPGPEPKPEVASIRPSASSAPGSARRAIIPAGQPLPPQPSANEIDPEALAKVSEIEKKAKRLSLMELTERTCKWPVGDPATEDFWFCGLPAKSGKPYCEAHVGVAFQPMSSRRDRKR